MSSAVQYIIGVVQIVIIIIGVLLFRRNKHSQTHVIDEEKLTKVSRAEIERRHLEINDKKEEVIEVEQEISDVHDKHENDTLDDLDDFFSRRGL